jgi:FKBP-type peptidyl-prolyl cis-trans isomerase FklB
MISKWMAAMAIGLLAVPAVTGEGRDLQTQDDKLRYAIGVDTGRNVRQLETRNAARHEINVQLAALKKKKASPRMRSPEENKRAGEAFLAENRKKEGVVVLPSGLQYKILKAGNGKIPADDNTVDCRVRAMHVDNTVFGGSPPGKPSTFKVGGTIPGLREALKLMPVGSKWQLFIPPELAYGEKGAGRSIGPNATLFYEVELLAIK